MFTTRLVKVATPALTVLAVVPDVKDDWGLPDLMERVTVPELRPVSTLP